MDFLIIAAKRASTDLVALESADRQVLATGTTTGSQAPVTVSVKAGLRCDLIDIQAPNYGNYDTIKSRFDDIYSQQRIGFADSWTQSSPAVIMG